MSIASSLELVAHAAGRLAGANAMASPATRSAASLRQLSAVWETYLRDAGAGDVGRDHQARNSGLFTTQDPRREGVVLWLIDYAAPALAESAATASRAIGAKQRLGSEAHDALAIAMDLMPAAPERSSAHETFEWLWSYAERLRRDHGFAETAGEMVEITVASGRLSTYRPAEPGWCWAGNLALAARAPTDLMLVPPAVLSRLLFRTDLDRDEQRQVLAADWLRALERSDASLWDAHRALQRGVEELSRLSKNARGREAWALIVATGELTRAQLTRALGLSRGGAGVVVGQLLHAGLVCSSRRSRLAPAVPRGKPSIPQGAEIADAAAEVDRAIADLDRLLARTAR